MALEDKILSIIKEAYPGAGKNKESEAPMQGSSEKPEVQVLNKGAGADAAKKAGAATSLAAGSGPFEKKNPKQGDSKEETAEVLDQDAPGKTAAAKAKKMPVPTAKGAGNAPNFKTVVDPATVVNQSSSKGNVSMEQLETDEVELTEEETQLLDEVVAKFDSIFASITADLELTEEDMEKLYETSLEAFLDQLTENSDDKIDVSELYALWRPKERSAKTNGVVSKKKQDADAKKKAAEREASAKKRQKLSDDFKLNFNSIFESESVELSEDFKEKTATLFETVVDARINDLREELETEAAEAAAEMVEEFSNDLIEKVDAYLNYVAEMWVEKNEAEVVNTIKAEVTESFINGLQKLFAEHYIEIPEERYDVLGELQATVDSLQKNIDQKIDENVELKEELDGMKRDAIIAKVSAGFASTDAEKFSALAEEISFENEELFEQKLNVIKENFFKKPVANKSLNEDFNTESDVMDVETTGSVLAYARAMKSKK